MYITATVGKRAGRRRPFSASALAGAPRRRRASGFSRRSGWRGRPSPSSAWMRRGVSGRGKRARRGPGMSSGRAGCFGRYPMCSRLLRVNARRVPRFMVDAPICKSSAPLRAAFALELGGGMKRLFVALLLACLASIAAAQAPHSRARRDSRLAVPAGRIDRRGRAPRGRAHAREPGVTVVVENVGGAGGEVSAWGALRACTPDGYTIDIGQWDTRRQRASSTSSTTICRRT